MKYFKLAAISIIFITFTAGLASAVSPTTSPTDRITPSPSTTLIDKLKQIEILKEKVATKAAELRENNKGATSGSVKSINDTSITLTTKKGEQTVSYAEDTVFFNMTDGNKSDPLDVKQAKKLKKNDQIAVLGYYDSSHTTLAAKYIYIVSIPLHIIGKIADKDTTNYTVTVKDAQGSSVIDIETYTKIYSYTKKSGLGRGGFSKLAENDVVHIFATPNPKEINRASALKIISFAFTLPTVTPAPSEKISSPSATPKSK